LFQAYGRLLRPGWRTLDVIEHTEETVHRVIRRQDSAAQPPFLKAVRSAPDEVRLTYNSARRLCALADDFGSEVHISQEELGTYVGAARESVNRQLQEWRRAGIIDLARGRISLLDIERLNAAASGE